MIICILARSPEENIIWGCIKMEHVYVFFWLHVYVDCDGDPAQLQLKMATLQ